MNTTFEAILNSSANRDATYRSLDNVIASNLSPDTFLGRLNAADYMYDVIHNMYMVMDQDKTGVAYTSALINEFRRRRTVNYNRIPEYIERVRNHDGTDEELDKLRASIDATNAAIVERLDSILAMFMADAFSMGS